MGMRQMVRKTLELLCVLALAGTASCFTPSVPIPPPDPRKISFDLDLELGSAQFEYQANADYGDAVVYVFIRSQGEGLITTARVDGSVGPTSPFPADEGDQVIISFEREDQISSACVELHDGPSSEAYECVP